MYAWSMLIHVKISPGARTDEIVQKNSTSYLVSVREPAEQNRANTAMLALLARHLKVELSQLRIITGHHSPGKIIEVIT